MWEEDLYTQLGALEELSLLKIVPPVKVLTSLCLVLPTTKNKITISQSK